MKAYAYAALAAGLVLAACSTQQADKATAALGTPAGSLFCAIQGAGGGSIIVSLVNAAATSGAAAAGASASAAVPLAILATDQTKRFVDLACAAAAGPGKVGVPVTPPADPAAAPRIAIVPPAA
jgi:hypothetical protein